MDCIAHQAPLFMEFCPKILEWVAIPSLIRHSSLILLIRHSLKYKITVSQKISYGDTELHIQVLTVNENL